MSTSKQSCPPSGYSCSFENASGACPVDMFDHPNLGAIHASCLRVEKPTVSTPQTQRTCSCSSTMGEFCLKSDKTQNSFLWVVINVHIPPPPPPESNYLRMLFQKETNGHIKHRQAVPIFPLEYVGYFQVTLLTKDTSKPVENFCNLFEPY